METPRCSKPCCMAEEAKKRVIVVPSKDILTLKKAESVFSDMLIQWSEEESWAKEPVDFQIPLFPARGPRKQYKRKS